MRSARNLSWAVAVLAALPITRAAAQPGRGASTSRPSSVSVGEPGTPLSEAARRIAADVPDEGTPNPGEHYPISNEFRHDLWFDHIRDLGGAFVGVGADQCYTLAAVQNASIVWVVDFDPLVPVIHRLYGVLVPATATPAELVARFEEGAVDATVALLEERLAGAPDREAVIGAYRRNRARMHGYLRRVLRNPRQGSWLSDPALYARVRALHEGGRVIARNGDVTANGALRAVGNAARQLGVPVRVLYFSNAEQFFPYGTELRANVNNLPVDERTVVLRTFREPGIVYPEGDRWHYMVQPFADMWARISENGYRNSRMFVRDLMARRSHYVGESGLSVLNGDVPRRYQLARDSD
ncbi:MAG: hypothetical protein AB7S26_19000 [Sandaracinaceae bacterium]